jgi:hypothetical protein
VAGAHQDVHIVHKVPRAEEALVAPLRQSLAVEKGFAIGGEEELGAREGHWRVDAVANLRHEAREAPVAVDARPLANHLVGGAQQRIVVRLADHGQVGRVHRRLFKHAAQQLQRARRRRLCGGKRGEVWISTTLSL